MNVQAPDITARSWAMIATLGVVWGGTFMVQSLALQTTAPFWVAAARVSFAALLTALVWRLRGGRMFTTPVTDWPRLTLVALLSSAIPFMCLSWGQQFVPSAFAGVSMASVTLFILPLAHLFLPGERMTLRRTAGFLLGFAGVAALIGPEALSATGTANESWGRAACLAAAGCYAVSSVMMRRLPPIDPIGLTFATVAIGALFVIPVAALVHGAPSNPGTNGLLMLALLGLVPTAGANLLRILVIRSAGPVFMSLTNYLVPLCSILFGWLILSEDLPGSLFLGMALILSGVFLSQWGALTRLFRRP
ncbi:DMT family transporter [Vannielia litorea]|uniref:Permease of the drug/metabolite transporter (DMT) superfamily n=1 Tax=Vannielia litorea TaxID=1217970 RepID=A0A1N6EJC0_9RHOB|nr:DMT family transporter [Vannielia litorea]SIN83040.1 Permease of the drug/metabolite transporter (DMT) superfamily [Vannielia litorea]